MIRVYNDKDEILDKQRYASVEHRKVLMKMWQEEYNWNIAYFQINPTIVMVNLTRNLSIQNKNAI